MHLRASTPEAITKTTSALPRFSAPSRRIRPGITTLASRVVSLRFRSPWILSIPIFILPILNHLKSIYLKSIDLPTYLIRVPHFLSPIFRTHTDATLSNIMNASGVIVIQTKNNVCICCEDGWAWVSKSLLSWSLSSWSWQCEFVQRHFISKCSKRNWEASVVGWIGYLTKDSHLHLNARHVIS